MNALHAVTQLFSAWGVADADARARQTEAVIDPGLYYADPNAPEPIQGAAAYLDYIAAFSAHMPGMTAEIAEFSDHHGHALATVDFMRDGTQQMRGRYFVDLVDGRITRLVGFSGSGAPA